MHGRFRNAEKLYQELQTARSQIKQVQIDKFIESMPHRCTKVIKNNQNDDEHFFKEYSITYYTFDDFKKFL